jgi:hypothetical protein
VHTRINVFLFMLFVTTTKTKRISEGRLSLLMSNGTSSSTDEREQELTRLLLEHLDCSNAMDQQNDSEELRTSLRAIETAIAHQCLGESSDASSSGFGAALLDAPRLAVMATTLTNPTLLEGWGVRPFASVSQSHTGPSGGIAASVVPCTTVQEVLRSKYQSPAPLGAEALRAIAKQTPLRQ